MKDGKKTRRYHGKVVSAIPGRLRIKLHPSKRSQALMDGIKHNLDSREGVHHVKLNSSTGSITVKYDHHRHGTNSVLGLLEDLDILVQSLGHVPVIGEPEGGIGKSTHPKGFPEALNDLNRRIFGMTRIPIDLKILLPLAFAGAGLWSIGKKGLMVESIPGWLFLWFAFDMFVKLHPAHGAVVKKNPISGTETRQGPCAEFDPAEPAEEQCPPR